MSMATENGRDETEKERIDRNLAELTAELRVALPGVQVLFAFLLVIPFNKGFETVTGFQKSVYLGTLLTTALSAVLLIAPTINHRLQFRTDNKAQILRDANSLSIAGLAVLAVAMCGALVLVSDYVFGAGAAIASCICVGLCFITLWYALPMLRMRARRRSPPGTGSA